MDIFEYDNLISFFNYFPNDPEGFMAQITILSKNELEKLRTYMITELEHGETRDLFISLIEVAILGKIEEKRDILNDRKKGIDKSLKEALKKIKKEPKDDNFYDHGFDIKKRCHSPFDLFGTLLTSFPEIIIFSIFSSGMRLHYAFTLSDLFNTWLYSEAIYEWDENIGHYGKPIISQRVYKIPAQFSPFVEKEIFEMIFIKGYNTFNLFTEDKKIGGINYGESRLFGCEEKVCYGYPMKRKDFINSDFSVKGEFKPDENDLIKCSERDSYYQQLIKN